MEVIMSTSRMIREAKSRKLRCLDIRSLLTVVRMTYIKILKRIQKITKVKKCHPYLIGTKVYCLALGVAISVCPFSPSEHSIFLSKVSLSFLPQLS